jgi:hypothetical protein
MKLDLSGFAERDTNIGKVIEQFGDGEASSTQSMWRNSD